MKIKNRLFIKDGIIIICVVIVLAIGLFTIHNFGITLPISEGLTAMISAIIGIVITTAITFLLLNRQSEYDRMKERSASQFEKKQAVYSNFFKTLEKNIIRLTDQSIKDNKGLAYNNVVVLEELIFKFAYIKVHMNDNNFYKIMSIVANILEKYRTLNLSLSYKTEVVQSEKCRSDEFNGKLYELTLELTNELLNISEILKEDLYGKSNEAINDDSYTDIQKFIKSCGLKPFNGKNNI